MGWLDGCIDGWMTGMWVDRGKGGEESEEGRQERNRMNNATVKYVLFFNLLGTH